MTRLSPVSPIRLEKILFKLGFEKVRQKGSHVFYRHPDGRVTTIVFHGNKEISPTLLHDILKEINLSREEYQKML